MASLFHDFKEHARAIHEDIKTLERTFRNPLVFYGTTSRSGEANTVLKNEIECVTNLSEIVEEQIQDMRASNNDTVQLLKEVEGVSEEFDNITKTLEQCGFVFSVENDDSDNNKEIENKDLANSNAENINHPEEPVEEHKDADYLCNKITDEEKKILELNEKYLEENNIDLDDIVTPYIPRKSMVTGKISG